MKHQNVPDMVKKLSAKLSLESEQEVDYIEKAKLILERQSIGTYCRNFDSPELERLVISMLGNCKRFDLRSRELKPLMAKARRRLVIGATEVAKQIAMDKIVGLVIATDIDDESLLDADFQNCLQLSVPKIFSCKRRQLSQLLTVPSGRVSIVGLRNVDGVEDDWKKTCQLAAELSKYWLESMTALSDYKNDYGQCLSWLCSFYGHFEVLVKLSRPLHGIHSIDPKSGKSGLHVAIERDHCDVVKLLIESGADQEAVDFGLNLPLHFAKSALAASMLSIKDKANASGLTPIEVAIVNGHCDVFNVLLPKIAKVDWGRLLSISCRCRNSHMIKQIIKSSDSFDVSGFLDAEGNSLIMLSVKYNSYEVFKFLGGSIGWDQIKWKHQNFGGQDIFQLVTVDSNQGIKRKLDSVNSKLL